MQLWCCSLHVKQQLVLDFGCGCGVVVVVVVVVAVVVVVVVVVAVVDRLLLLLLRLPLPLPLLPHISPHPFTILYTLVWVPTPLIMSNDTRLKAPLAKARGRHSNARPWRDAAKSPLRLVSRGVGAPLLAQNGYSYRAISS